MKHRKWTWLMASVAVVFVFSLFFTACGTATTKRTVAKTPAQQALEDAKKALWEANSVKASCAKEAEKARDAVARAEEEAAKAESSAVSAKRSADRAVKAADSAENSANKAGAVAGKLEDQFMQKMKK